jgi:alkylated DNA repair dioxygenase AlkB
MSRCPIDEDGNLIDHIPGLEYYRDFLSPREQAELLALIDANPWQEGVIARRQQFYGEVYYHTSFKSKVLQGCGSNSNHFQPKNNGNKNSNSNSNSNESENGSVGNEQLDNSNSGNSDIANEENGNGKQRDMNDSNTGSSGDTDNKSSGNGIPIDDSGMRKWLNKTMPFFEQEGLMEAPSQVLINEYKNNMGIASHFEDFDAFGPIILTVSLVSPVYMTLKKPTQPPANTIINEGNNNLNACDTYEDIVKVLLEPGSLLVMKGDARYKYRHGIGKYKWVHLPPSATTATSTSPSEIKASIKRDDSYRRVSVTIRHLLSTRRKVRGNEDESDTIKDPSVY